MHKIFWFLMVSLIIGTVSVSATDVSITSQIKGEKVHFTYKFEFSKDDGLSTVAFEKPTGSKFLNSTNTFNEDISPIVAGDFFIFEMDEDTRGENLTIEFETQELYNTLKSTDTFSTYVSFNFEPINLEYKHIPGEYAQKDYYEVFPRDYVLLENDEMVWNINNMSSDKLFLVSYNPEDSQDTGFINESIFLVLLLIPVLFFVVLIIFLRLSSRNINSRDNNAKRRKEDTKEEKYQKEESIIKEDSVDSNKEIDEKSNEETNEEPSQNQKEEENNEKSVDQEPKFEELFDDFISKYLTENEQEVSKIVKENEGIPQNDILDYTNSLTKSNLSKIVSKLNNKKIFNRIKVGKVNKIYLGERLKYENLKTNLKKEEEKKE